MVDGKLIKILLVEDDKDLREIYGIRLTAEGYKILSAGDGQEALAIAVQEKPDLILSDVMMPNISGFDMLDILKTTDSTKDIKIIMMTALSSEEQRERGAALGADRYLVKSQVGIEDVIKAVHEVLGDKPQEAGALDISGIAGEVTVAPMITTKPAHPQSPEPTDSGNTMTTPDVPTPHLGSETQESNPEPDSPSMIENADTSNVQSSQSAPVSVTDNSAQENTEMPSDQTIFGAQSAQTSDTKATESEKSTISRFSAEAADQIETLDLETSTGFDFNKLAEETETTSASTGLANVVRGDFNQHAAEEQDGMDINMLTMSPKQIAALQAKQQADKPTVEEESDNKRNIFAAEADEMILNVASVAKMEDNKSTEEAQRLRAMINSALEDINNAPIKSELQPEKAEPTPRPQTSTKQTTLAQQQSETLNTPEKTTEATLPTDKTPAVEPISGPDNQSDKATNQPADKSQTENQANPLQSESAVGSIQTETITPEITT